MRRAPADADRPRSPERGTDLPTYRQPGVDAQWSELAGRRSGALARRVRLARLDDDLRPASTARGRANELEPVARPRLRRPLRLPAVLGRRVQAPGPAQPARRTCGSRAPQMREGRARQVLRRRHRPDLGHRPRLRRAAPRPASSCAAPSTASGRTASTGRSIRSAARKGPPRTDAACSNCGAPLQITQAGTCDHCGAHVTAGRVRLGALEDRAGRHLPGIDRPGRVVRWRENR